MRILLFRTGFRLPPSPLFGDARFRRDYVVLSVDGTNKQTQTTLLLFLVKQFLFDLNGKMGLNISL